MFGPVCPAEMWTMVAYVYCRPVPHVIEIISAVIHLYPLNTCSSVVEHPNY